jgi:hypothetical protein
METADPRAELIRRWSIESPGLMAQAGVLLEQEGFLEAVKIKGVTDVLAARNRTAEHGKKDKKGHAQKKLAKHKGGEITAVQREILKHAFPNGHTHEESTHKHKKRVNPYKNPSFTPATLSAAQVEHTAEHKAILQSIYALIQGQTTMPEAIKPAAMTAWSQIMAYKDGKATLSDVVPALQVMYNATGLHSKKEIFNTIRLPQAVLKQTDGESYVLDKFLTILVKYVQKNVKGEAVRAQHHYKYVKSLSKRLKKTKRHLKEIETAMRHKTTHQAP